MSRGHLFLAILAITVLSCFESGNGLKCYQCSSVEDGCVALEEKYLKECPQPTSTEKPGETTTETTEETTTEKAQETTTEKAEETTTETTEKTTTKKAEETTTKKAEGTENTEPVTTEETTPETTEETTTETTEETTTETTEETTTETTEGTTATTTTATTKTAGVTSEGPRRRRSVIDRFSRVFADDQPVYKCGRVNYKTSNGTTGVEMGCFDSTKITCDTAKKVVEGQNATMTECMTCDTDKCNFASTNVALVTLLLPLTLVVFLTK